MSAVSKHKTRSIFGRSSFTWAKYLLLGFTLVGLLAPLICNDSPLLARSNSGDLILPWSKTALYTDWSQGNIYLKPLIPYTNATIDKKSINWKPPLYRPNTPDASRHWLGSSKLGKDVFAGMVYGSKSAIIIAFFSIGLAFIIGVSLGMLAGYAKNNYWKANPIQMLWSLFLILFIVYYFFSAIFYLDVSSFMVFVCLLVVLIYSFPLLKKLPLKSYSIPVDTIVIKLIEIRKSIPLIYLLLAATALIQEQSIWILSAIIGCVVWVPFARHSRASTLSLVEEGYIRSAKALGLSDFQILSKHIFKGILPQVTVVAAFAMSGAIVLEATLSFLGMGLPVEYLTWGSMLAEAKQNTSAWWMAVFPGTGIFLTVLACNIIGEHLSHE